MGCSANPVINDDHNDFKTSNNYKIYKAYKLIKNLNDEIKNQNILKKDQLYLIYIQSIQNFVNSIEEFSNKEKSCIQRQLKDEDPKKYEFDKLEFIDENNYQNKNEFIIVNKQFLEVLGIEQNDNSNNKSIIIDINKEKNISQIEFNNHNRYNFTKLDKCNLCYNLNNNTIVVPNNLNSISNNLNNNNTIVETNNLNNINNIN